MSCEMGLCVRGDLGSLYVDNQGYVPALLESLSVCLALEFIASWVVVGFSVGMGTFG